MKHTVELWRQSLLAKDLATAAALRDDGYSAILPHGNLLSKEQELALLSSDDHRVVSLQIENLRISVQGTTATAVFDASVERERRGGARTEVYLTFTITFHKRDDRWRAATSRVQLDGEIPRPPRSLTGWLRNKVRTYVPSFEELAYLPYKPKSDFALPRGPVRNADGEDAGLPIPPPELWLGYNYRAQARGQVETMLEIVRASGVDLEPGGRILDFGCGAGRMIRHLQSLATTCEIWGTDISAEHILWCKRHLQPPFHFATTTKVPHLPFEDRSFRLIYCGSVFTHIDDLADAWLLELRRILATDGRLYLTIHDEHTIELWDNDRRYMPWWLALVLARKTYRESKGSSDMFTIGRGHNSQVFYNRDYFLRTLDSMFDVVSVTPEAYFAQTGVLVKRKAAGGR